MQVGGFQVFPIIIYNTQNIASPNQVPTNVKTEVLGFLHIKKIPI